MSNFREMRRKSQQLSEEESIGILQKATAGTLALLGDNGYPYAVSNFSWSSSMMWMRPKAMTLRK